MKNPYMATQTMERFAYEFARLDAIAVVQEIKKTFVMSKEGQAAIDTCDNIIKALKKED